MDHDTEVIDYAAARWHASGAITVGAGETVTVDVFCQLR
jgi:hypothetical protein